jgi:squalene synthase HpnC
MSQELLPGRSAEAAPVEADTDAMTTKAARENFPVALRLLPARRREQLMAVYAFARMTDDIGDEGPAAGRLARLDDLEADLLRLEAGTPERAEVRGLRPVVAQCRVPLQLFADLIQANRQDQVVSRYQTFDDLLGYCRLSANPVGRIVLYVFDAFSAERAGLSDQICTALQLAEHWQDVAEDLRNGRVYLPAEDLDRYHCTEADLAAPTAGPAVRELMTFQVRRAGSMLSAGAPLIGTLRGFARASVAGYVAGGRAALAAIRTADHDVLSATRKPGRRRLAAELVRALVTGR